MITPQFWRRVRWLVLALLLSSIVIGGASYQIWMPAVPPHAIPVVHLNGVDPEIVAAIEAARAVVERQPQSNAAWGELAMVLHVHRFTTAAVYCYEAAAERDTRNANWPYLRGLILMDEPSGPESALPCFEEALRLAPANPQIRTRLAEVLLDLNRLDDAGRELAKVIQTHPNDSRGHFGLAKLALARRQYKDALVHLDTLRTSRYAQKHCAALRAVALERLGDRVAAELERSRFVDLTMDESWPEGRMQPVYDRRVGLKARFERARQFGGQGRDREAVALLQETVRLYPNSDEAWVALGKLLAFEWHDEESGEEAIVKGIELAPRRAEYRQLLGELRMVQKRHQEAEAFYRLALKLNFGNPEIHFLLGECLKAQGDESGSEQEYRLTLRLAPGHRLAQHRLPKQPDVP